jgi:15-cis-phytoene synthase
MIRTGSRSFFAASMFLPERVRSGAYALYAFCRLSDDAVDEAHGGEAAVERLAARLDSVYAGAPDNRPVDRALADAVERFAIPRAPFDALLEGLLWDAQGRSCETLSDLYAYAARVAGSVGAMMAALMGARTPDLVARACDLGVAMQLTNIARDVGEDARAGRLYLPRTIMREAGIDPDSWLATPVFNPAIAKVVARLLSCADALYARADSGIAALPPAFQPAIGAARRLYAEIGVELARNGFDSVSTRTVVPAVRKLQLTMLALPIRKRVLQADLHMPALPQTQFLVDAAIARNAHAEALPPIDGAQWVLGLFSALEDRPRRVA